MQRITVKNAIPQTIGVANGKTQKIGFENSYTIISGDPYEGEYTIIPSRFRQTLQTCGKAMLENVVIEPIPNNYGLITYNGFELTIF